MLGGSIDSQGEQPELESLQGGLSKTLGNLAQINLFPVDGQHNPAGQRVLPDVSINTEEIMWEGGTRISCILQGKLQLRRQAAL